MKTIGLIGCQSDFISSLAAELGTHGLRVAVVRQGDIGIAEAEIARHVPQFVLSGEEHAVLFMKGGRTFDEIVRLLDADLLLVEGFEDRQNFPRLLCSGADVTKDMLSGLELCAVGDASPGLGIPVLTDIPEIAELVRRSAFSLAGLDCGKCGFSNCHDLAVEIVRGEKSERDCVALHPELEITIGGEPLPLVPFVSELIRNVILGILSSLKGAGPGTVEVRMEQD